MSRTLNDLRADFRERVQVMRPQDLSDRVIDLYLTTALETLASELEYSYTTDTTTIALVADTQEYSLPATLNFLLFVEWNDKRLTPKSVHDWDRAGVDWRGAASGTLSEYAVQGRKLIFHPKPDSDAVTDDSAATIRYIAASAGTTTAGATNLADQDTVLAVYLAAAEWLGMHPSNENLARKATLDERVALMLPRAKKRNRNAAFGFQPGVVVATRRSGASR